MKNQPLVLIKPNLNEGLCVNDTICLWHQEEMQKKLIGKKYLRIKEEPELPDQIQTAVIDLESYKNFEDYIAEAKKIHKGNSFRKSHKSKREGFYSKPFNPRLFIPDIVEINHSKEVRCGRKMSEPYRRTVQDFGGPPQKRLNFQWPECPLHFDLWWGIFMKKNGHCQGVVETGEKLFAYIRLRRNGNYALYGQILGHGEYLNKGIMYALHFNILEWLLKKESGYAKGLSYLCYAGYNQGGEGLIRWKKRTLFRPTYLVISEKDMMQK
ncbi:hypothetical protein OOT00_15810 [Desulfobotulus sp. H1]|uniref:N-acetyltransferase domain-containing protein n=1 Tax=Desulfobotulus pelophilus TaxID=2823377 RepID=A0ABT3NDA1_9BACT|nr:hypothetical protein [Desulfobotulus pelophilus]MCW7755442.1 hypothetical protein [Desulfobotulus pelophilus]